MQPDRNPTTTPSPSPSLGKLVSDQNGVLAQPSASSNAAPSPPSSNTYWSTSPISPPRDPSGSDVLTSANYWRQKWNSTLGTFTWSSLLANNSYETTITPTTYTTNCQGQQVPHGEGDATVLGHVLYPGSFAQCIASGKNVAINGTLTPFDNAFLKWICEEPNGLQEGTDLGYVGNAKDTGHAEIIKGTYNQIGCYWMGSNILEGGLWTCDFTGGADDYI